jgi:putative ABC transport system permease protein
MNLSTARSASRAKEVGVRKVLGAYRQHLVFQFLSEAFIITLISILIATAASTLILPFFNQLADKSIVISNLFTPLFFGIMLVILVIVGLLAGSYPAFYLSKFKPVEVLKGKLNLGMKSGGIRSILVVIQFSISIIMMVGTAIVFNQLNYVQNKKLGFDKDQILMIEDAWLLKNNLDAFKTEVLRDPHVINGTVASFLPVGTTNNNNMWFKGKNAGQGDNYIMHNYRIDHNYIETLGMEMADGRNFSEDFLSDSSAVLINEAAAKQIGYENTVGEFIATYGGSQQETTSDPYKIIGVVKDFHFSTMRENITPLIFTLDERKGFISFKIQSDDISNTVKSINKQWDALAPGQPFQYSFLDDRFNEMYESEQKIGNIFSVFAFLAIFIACLGLYGLAAFTAEQKNKEIGIRKVLGASIAQIISLLSKEFVRLLIISFVIGSVTSYFVMREWLNEFVYRVDINDPTSFIVAGIATLVISWVTMSSQSLKAARANPVNSLKDE